MVETTKKFQAQLPDNTRLMLPVADESEVDPDELPEDGQEPGSDLEPPPEEHKVEPDSKQTESDIMFENLQSATLTQQVDADWVKTTISISGKTAAKK